MKIIGIDPGLNGAIVIMENNKVLSVFDMPVMSEGKKNKRQLNSAQLVRIIKENTLANDDINVVKRRNCKQQAKLFNVSVLRLLKLILD